MPREWKEAFCPLCGISVGMRNIYVDPKKPWTKTGEKNLWEETRAFNGDKPFGVIKSSEGRSSLKFVRYFDVGEDTDGFFPPMKARMLAAMKEWLEKGWITWEELEEAIA